MRAAREMVHENDPQWLRFWDSYPRRCAKKEARKAWASLRPSSELVDQMIEALRWQTVEWAQEQCRYAPYPASWLRGERWNDVPPVKSQRVMSDAAATVLATLGVKL